MPALMDAGANSCRCSQNLIDRHLAGDAAQCDPLCRHLEPAGREQRRGLCVLDHLFRRNDRARGSKALDARRDVDRLAKVVLLTIERDRQA